MKYRIRATFSPPARLMRLGVPPEQVERFCETAELAEQLRELVMAGDGLLKSMARLVIEVVPADEGRLDG